jgi:hypothetical protein
MVKFRGGFVSNSSSSSFVLLVPKDVHERILEEVHPFVSTVARKVMRPVSAFGQEFVAFHELTVQDYSSVFYDFVLEYEGERPEGIGIYEAFYEEYQGKLKDGEYLSLSDSD